MEASPALPELSNTVRVYQGLNEEGRVPSNASRLLILTARL